MRRTACRTPAVRRWQARYGRLHTEAIYAHRQREQPGKAVDREIAIDVMHLFEPLVGSMRQQEAHLKIFGVGAPELCAPFLPAALRPL